MSTTTLMLSAETGIGLIFLGVVFLFTLVFILNIFYPVQLNMDKKIRD